MLRVSGTSLVGWLNNSPISLTTGLYSLTVNTWRTSCSKAALACLFLAIVVDVFEVESVDVAWDVSVNLLTAALDRFATVS